jgi:hypothetical protein
MRIAREFSGQRLAKSDLGVLMRLEGDIAELLPPGGKCLRKRASSEASDSPAQS